LYLYTFINVIGRKLGRRYWKSPPQKGVVIIRSLSINIR